MRGFNLGALACFILSLTACGERQATELEGVPAGPYRLTLRFDPAPPMPARETRLTFELTRTTSRAPVRDLQTIHERVLHTFIVARDFSSFAHLHHEDFSALNDPTRQAAKFTFPYAFPRAGEYRVVSEFTHRDRTWIKQFDFSVGEPVGESVPRVDLARARTVGTYAATLVVAPPQPVAGYETELVLDLARGGKPVDDLQLLLGAEVHVALWRLDGAHFGHTHSFTPHMAAMMREMAGHGGEHSAAMMLKMMAAPAELVYPGPRIPIRFTFPAPGVYQLFLQCAPGGEVQVFPFMLEVETYREGMQTTFDTIVPDA